MRRFRIWLAVFFVLLMLVPVLIWSQYIVFAKIMGVLVTLLLSIAVRLWLRNTKRQYKPVGRIKMNTNDRFLLEKEYDHYRRLSARDRKSIEDNIGVFLSRVPICFSSGELVSDRSIAIKLAYLHVVRLDLNNGQVGGCPDMIILEDGQWKDELRNFSENNNCVILDKINAFDHPLLMNQESC